MACSPLLRLPTELLQHVTSYLDLQDQARFSMVNRHLRHTLGAPTHSDFLGAETGAWAITKQLYTCKGCVRFRDLRHFADDMRKGARARNGPEAQARLCLDCGVENGWYSEGAKVEIYGKPAVLVRLCSKLTDHGECVASCGSGTLAWSPLQREEQSTYSDGNRRGHDDDWVDLPQEYTSIMHTQVYGLWLDM